jgi:hypothetical protein
LVDDYTHGILHTGRAAVANTMPELGVDAAVVVALSVPLVLVRRRAGLDLA